MRYGTPSIENAIRKLKHSGVTDIVIFPLYPQYSLAATESSIDASLGAIRRILPHAKVRILPPFFDHPAYLDAVAMVSRSYMEIEPFDLAVFSFHGLPERQVRKARQNYRDQCFKTAEEIASRLNLPPDRYQVSFQSRLGRTPWIKPYTDELYREFPNRGVKRIVVLCPSFVADCLETLEEVAIRGREDFLRHGGTSLRLIPSLNSSAPWVDTVATLLTTPERKQTSRARQ